MVCEEGSLKVLFENRVNLVICSRTLSNRFIVNLKLIWLEIVISNPDSVAGMGISVRASSKVRVGIGVCVV